MQSVLRLALVDPCSETREEMKRILADMDPVWVEAECPQYEQLPEVLSQTTPDVVVIGIDSDPTRGLEMVSEAARSSPETRVIVTSNVSDSHRILQAMRCGAHEYLTTPVQMDDLLPALDRVRESHVRRGSGATGPKVIAIGGVVGGVGATSI